MDRCGRFIRTFMVFCFYRYQNCFGKFSAPCNSSIQICFSRNDHVIFCLSFPKTKMANAQAMEAGNHLWLTEYHHLFGLLHHGNAIHNSRHRCFVCCYQSFIHQLLVGFFVEKKIKIRSFYCFTVRNSRRVDCVVAFIERCVHYFRRLDFVIV